MLLKVDEFVVVIIMMKLFGFEKNLIKLVLINMDMIVNVIFNVCMFRCCLLFYYIFIKSFL